MVWEVIERVWSGYGVCVVRVWCVCGESMVWEVIERVWSGYGVCVVRVWCGRC